MTGDDVTKIKLTQHFFVIFLVNAQLSLPNILVTVYTRMHSLFSLLQKLSDVEKKNQFFLFWCKNPWQPMIFVLLLGVILLLFTRHAQCLHKLPLRLQTTAFWTVQRLKTHIDVAVFLYCNIYNAKPATCALWIHIITQSIFETLGMKFFLAHRSP